MKIPARIKVGRKKYVIEQPRSLSRSRRGHWTAEGRIIIARSNELGQRHSTTDKSEAFWHELTHAILDDMKHPLWSNEVFVTAFAKRLSRAVDSAEFE